MGFQVAQASLVGDVPILGPIGIAVTTLTAVASQILPADPVRHGLMFHNPSETVTKRVLPVGQALAGGAGGILIYPQTEIIILQDDDRLLNVNAAWVGVTDDNSDPSLTIFNFTDNNPSVPAPEMVASVNYGIPRVSPTGPGTVLLGTTSVPLLPFNQNRRGVLFQNSSPTPIAVCPANLPAVFGAGGWTILPGQERRLIARGRVRVNCGWNAIAQSGSNVPVSPLEFV